MAAVASSKWMLHTWWLRIDFPHDCKRFGCTPIHNKKRYINASFIHSFNPYIEAIIDNDKFGSSSEQIWRHLGII